MREDGLVVIEDRLKELIKYKGYQVTPEMYLLVATTLVKPTLCQFSQSGHKFISATSFSFLFLLGLV